MLSDNDSRWDIAVRRLGDPLILLGHEGAAAGEASLLTHPRWRCVYFDAIASVFVPRSGESSAHRYPDLDFAAATFAGGRDESAGGERQRLMAKATALLRLATVLRKLTLVSQRPHRRHCRSLGRISRADHCLALVPRRPSCGDSSARGRSGHGPPGVWAEVNDPPSQALRLTRMAGADLAALDAAAALARCRTGLELDDTLGEAWYVLVIALVETGRAEEALAAVGESLKRPLTASERRALIGIEALLNRSRQPSGTSSRAPALRTTPLN
jgi:hypothetical protein